MKLVSTPDPPVAEGLAVRWTMADGKRKLTCWVRAAALEKLEGNPDLAKSEYVGTFSKFRGTLEASANAIFERGLLDGNAIVIRKENV